MLRQLFTLLFGLLGLCLTTQSLYAQGSETVSIGEAFNECPVYVPTAFTPNGDNKNDSWGLGVNPDCTQLVFNLRIYDRWGRLMYHTLSPAREFWWNGSYEGNELKTGVYMWQLDAVYQTPNGTDRVEIRDKGTLMLVR